MYCCITYLRSWQRGTTVRQYILYVYVYVGVSHNINEKVSY